MLFGSRASRPSLGENCFRLCLPQSTTKRTPGTVTEVSAMFVLMITFRVFGGVRSKTFCCAVCGKAANRGRISSFGTPDFGSMEAA